MNNPFEIIDSRLSNIENLLLDLKHPPASKQSDEYITRKEAADILHITLPTLNNRTTEGKLKGYRMGRRVLYKRGEIEGSATPMATNKQVSQRPFAQAK